MTIVTADDALLAVLGGLKEKAEVRDTRGNVLGYFTPRELEEELLYRLADEAFDPKDLQRQMQEEKEGCSIEQVMQHLRSLGSP